MILGYVGSGLLILVMNLELIPSAFGTIFESTLSAEAIGGGALGCRHSLRCRPRCVSNEAGLGSLQSRQRPRRRIIRDDKRSCR